MKNKESIRWKIQNYLILFIISALTILWVFQVLFLDDFYRVIKTHEVKTFATQIQKEYNRGTLGNITVDAEMYAYIVNSQGKIIARPEKGYHPLVQEIPSVVYQAIFSNISSNKGLIINMNNMNDFGMPRDGLSISTLTYAYRMDDSAMVVIQAQIVPVDATVKTIQVQLLIVSLLLIVIAYILSRTLTKRISAPMIEINESAKVLATGNYDEPFTGKGYKEIEELTQTLNSTRKELAKVEKMRNELIANVSHDLRTPLTMITGYAELMKDIPEEMTQENLEVIMTEAHYLNSLVEELLDLSKMQSSSNEVSIDHYDLVVSLNDLSKRFGNLYPKRELIVTAPDSVFVKANQGHVNRVLYNLINNAMNYSDGGVEVILKENEESVRISVCDEGVGLNDEELSKIWTRYYRSDSDHKRMVHGSGLGLSIVKNIFDASHIKYGVNNKEPHGLEFWFEIEKIEKESVKE